MCIPRGEQANILREAHDDPTAGHPGLAKTLIRLARQYYWPGMLRMSAKYVRTCFTCQKHKAQQQATAGKMHATHVDQPWQMISTDLIGPLPRSTAGHTWPLVIQDRFTKWIELHPPKKAIGKAVTEAVRTQICLRHGCPDVIVTDNV